MQGKEDTYHFFHPNLRHTNTAYDLASRPTRAFVSMQTATPYDASLERDIRTYVYDAAGRVIEDRVRPNNGGMGTAELVLKYGYDAANNRTSIEWPDQYRATYLYDAAPAAAQEVRVPFADLDLSSAAGARAFDGRAADAAREVCAFGPRGLVNDNCVRRIQREAVRALPAAPRADYARARRGERVLAMVAPAWPV